ncbi:MULTISPECIES: YafY family protein [Nocardia]|uniref:helix-turn-helix transcriptional regulator n=1 Tax=Nocardia TaxID=1817 RepID=UPI0007EAE99D|nr:MULTISPECIES: WYL domain-containing protein [Nocardia]OBF75275.1 transcriptional regulator [Mycobacterium sp. 852002-51759_SCH5129042]MBF6273455.1 WYL domain-containing protein [Nocardia nova]OBA50270.1 transcriptional regulator [Nocardia sp. 852002-51101_SCH5132738]OBB48789.1 transcriptional regulator [Nocardia sp. 852002-51244_SCH5132740]PPI98473.1 transcriptional regulator [Nocardia nova]
MRADRLIATLLLMQARGRVTAAELARELEVSVATARRDLEALSSAGVPVYPQPGRGGGWALIGGARTDLSGMTADEARALFLLLGPAASGSPATRSALRKLLRALPETFREQALAASAATLIDPVGWGRRPRSEPAEVELLQQAVARRRTVRFRYGPAGRERAVDPWGVVDKDAVWYLIAGTDRGRRTYRVDRMSEVTVGDGVADVPADFDLAQAWSEIVEQMEHRRGDVSAIVHADPEIVPVLRDRLGRHCAEDGPVDGGRVRLRISAHLPRAIAEQLAGFGGRLEVVAPESIRRELAALAAELTAIYR